MLELEKRDYLLVHSPFNGSSTMSFALINLL